MTSRRLYTEENIKTKSQITRKMLNPKNFIDEKRLRIAFYVRIHIKKYQNPIIC